jgi:hypothetical protein
MRKSVVIRILKQLLNVLLFDSWYLAEELVSMARFTTGQFF